MAWDPIGLDEAYADIAGRGHRSAYLDVSLRLLVDRLGGEVQEGVDDLGDVEAVAYATEFGAVVLEHRDGLAIDGVDVIAETSADPMQLVSSLRSCLGADDAFGVLWTAPSVT